jgi:hypothetical protein
MNAGLFLDWILPPADWDQSEPSWLDFTWCFWMANDELVTNDLTIDNVPGVSPPDDYPD